MGEAARPAATTFFLTMGLGILAAIAGSPDAAAGLMVSSSYFATLSMLTYSRVQESAADQAAATYLEKSGQSGRGLVEFFNNFASQEVFDDSKKYPFFRDHPLTSDRIDALRVRVEALPHYKQADAPEALAEHELMIAKLKAFMNPPNQTFVEYKEKDTSFPARYARAIAYYKATETDKALARIDALITDYPDNPYLWELKGQVLFEAGRAKESEPAYQKAVALKPNAPLLRIGLGQTLIALDDKTRLDEAIGELKKSLTLEQDNAFAWRLLAQAYDSKGLDGLARLATAEQNFALGQMPQAHTFALRARDLLPRNSPEWRRATDIILVSGPPVRNGRPDRDGALPRLVISTS